MNTNLLFQRLAQERYDESQRSEGEHVCSRSGGCRCRAQWNSGSEHAERIIRQWLEEERVLIGLAEIQTAPALDLRLKATLTGLEEPQEGMA